jgi:uncharacterized protein Yka (UPF0111/DUF47 family)
MSMDELEKLPSLLEKLNELEEQFPNVVAIWKSYMNKKIEKLVDDINQCENVINELETNGDIIDVDLNTITLLSIIFQSNNAINN